MWDDDTRAGRPAPAEPRRPLFSQPEEATVTLLIDPPILIAAGAVAARRLPPARRRRARWVGVGVFWAAGVPLYLERRGRGPLPRLRAHSGRDVMLRTWVLPIDHRRAGWRTHVVAGAVFASYPLWWRLGERLADRLAERLGDELDDAARIEPLPPA